MLQIENEPDNALAIEELSIYLKISRSTLYKLVRGEGKSPFKRQGVICGFKENSLMGG
jgi:predicted DNA-binding transcriptional regulator AlpA